MIFAKAPPETGRDLRRAITVGVINQARRLREKILGTSCLEDALLLTSSVQKPFSVAAL
jgi:hypothetical protein